MSFELSEYCETVRLTDGAWGTELQKRGLDAGACPELMNVNDPAAVEAVAASYVAAGSDVILTNTFGGNRFALAGSTSSPQEGEGASDRAAELCRCGAEISVRAAAGSTGSPQAGSTGSPQGGTAKVFGSMGPTGKIVMMGELPPEELEMAFAEAATALSHGRVDAIVLETFNELDELEIALKAVKETTNLPVVASMTFSSGPDGTATMMGNTPGDLARLAEEFGADAVGANCGVGPDNYVKVAAMLRAASTLPVWIKANAGLPQLGADGQTLYPMGPAAFAECVRGLVDAGADFIGGCCGTTPEHIRAVRDALDNM